MQFSISLLLVVAFGTKFEVKQCFDLGIPVRNTEIQGSESEFPRFLTKTKKLFFAQNFFSSLN